MIPRKCEAPDDPIERAEFFERYFRGKQYKGLTHFINERDSDKNLIPIRFRAPNVRYNICRAIANRMVGFLFGDRTFPTFSSSEAPEANNVLTWIRDKVMLASFPDALRKVCVQGSAAITFGFRRGKLKVRTFTRTKAQPIFDDAGELLCLVVKYHSRHPETNKPGLTRMTLDSENEVWEFQEADDKTGEWKLLESIGHKAGFVPAVWIRHLGADDDSADGESLLEEIPELQEEIDYSLSQRARSLRYTSDPQTIIKSKNPQQTKKNLAKSPAGTWLLDATDDISYLEIIGKGTEMQGNSIHELRKAALEVARVVLPDADAVKGQMSGYALRILYEAMIDLADELKTPWTAAMNEFLSKVLLYSAMLRRDNQVVRIPDIERVIPKVKIPTPATDTLKRYHPWLGNVAREFKLPVYSNDVLPISVAWGAYFDTSPAEEKDIVTAASTAKNSGLLSTSSGVRFIAPTLGIGDVKNEVLMIEQEEGQIEP